jgi:hypothetical protein
MQQCEVEIPPNLHFLSGKMLGKPRLLTVPSLDIVLHLK